MSSLEARPGAPAPGGPQDDWAHHLAVQLESVTEAVERRTIQPATTVTRAIVFGLVVAALGQLGLILVLIGVIRVMDVYLFPGRVWIPYLIFGGILSIAGLFLWRLRVVRRKGSRA